MSERLLDLKAMLGFIVCTAKAKRGLDTDDETLREITETDAGETDLIITDTLDAIIQKIRRATAINVMAQ